MLVYTNKWKKSTIILIITTVIILNLAYIVFYNYNQFQARATIKISSTNQLNEQEMIDSAEIIKNRLEILGYPSTKYRIKNKEITYILHRDIDEKEILHQVLKPQHFEAKIGEKTIMDSINLNTYYVQTTGENTGINVCEEKEKEIICTYTIGINLYQDTANKLAQATKNLTIIETETTSYLSENITFFVDDEIIKEILLDSSMKGQEIEDIIITGEGKGKSIQEARIDALTSIKQLHATLTSPPLLHDFYIVNE